MARGSRAFRYEVSGFAPPSSTAHVSSQPTHHFFFPASRYKKVPNACRRPSGCAQPPLPAARLKSHYLNSPSNPVNPASLKTG